jgi:hypothetical protein
MFINVGRGTIISEPDLINALNNKWIKGAVLDVCLARLFVSNTFNTAGVSKRTFGFCKCIVGARWCSKYVFFFFFENLVTSEMIFNFSYSARFSFEYKRGHLRGFRFQFGALPDATTP